MCMPCMEHPAIEETQNIDLVIRLEDWDKDKDYDRLGLEEEHTEYLGNQVVCHVIPIRPGRNLAVICETAAINHRLKKMGYNAAQELYRRVQENMSKEELIMKYAIGIDVGGTSVKLGLVSEEGELLEKWEIPTRTEDAGKNVLPDIAISIKEKMLEKGISAADVCGTGIGLPGPVDDEGVIRKAVNLHWDRIFNVADELSELLGGMKVKAGNDANVAALGEYWQGAGKDYGDMVMVTLGTGIGGGIIHHGQIFAGTTGAGGEIGHLCLNPDEKIQCNCGNSGCLEQYASATGIVRLTREELEASDEDSLLRDTEITAKAMWDAVKAGDALAIRVADRFGFYLGWGLSVIAGVVNPEVFVLGGGVSQAGDIILPFVRKNFEEHAFHACRDAQIVIATLGNGAGTLGAAKMVID